MVESIPFPDKKYKLILADPPWTYRNKRTGGSMKSGAAQKYETMLLEEICKLDIKSIAMKNSVLFLWGTTPLLPEAFQVMKAWGFKYHTAVVWRKIMSQGLGWWFRTQTEFCLLGTRGKIKAFGCQRPNFFQSKVGDHSSKPSKLHQLIEPIIRKYDLNPKIELFARGDIREGWDAWGKEVGDHIQKRLEAWQESK